MGVFQKIIGDPNERVIKDLQLTVNLINEWGPRVVNKTPEELRQRTQEFKEEYQAIAKDKGIKAADNYLDEILPEAFAAVREASKRTTGLRHYDVQLLGGMVLHGGRIAEMKTGEGKTLVATLAVYLNALEGKGVHVVTVNDYLAKRDAAWMGKIYEFLGLTTGVIVHGLSDTERRDMYACDVTYATNNELGFDYLRDNMKYHLNEMVQRGHHYAIVDEVDSILIDEARTPLIISGPLDDKSDLYNTLDKYIPELTADDYELDEKQREIEPYEHLLIYRAARARCDETLLELDGRLLPFVALEW